MEKLLCDHGVKGKLKLLTERTSPGALITSAIIGPGTITTCIKAGYTSSYSLLGVVGIAVILACIIQYYAAKLGVITRHGLCLNIKRCVKSKRTYTILSLFVATAITLGNCAFETGNISGAAVGLQLLSGASTSNAFVFAAAAFTGIILWKGSLKSIQKFLGVIVLLMMACFLGAAIIVRPDARTVLQDLLSLNLNQDTLLTGAILGTTIGPYNIFLHSEASSLCWDNPDKLHEVWFDTVISILIGGLISCCIIILAATITDMARMDEISILSFGQILEVPLGVSGGKIFSVGLFAAGLSSAITAPLAAAYIVEELFFDECTSESKRIAFRATWIIVIVTALIIINIWEDSSAELIVLAQYINSLILPFIILVLLYCLNHVNEKYRNGTISNLIILITAIICTCLSLQKII